MANFMMTKAGYFKRYRWDEASTQVHLTHHTKQIEMWRRATGSEAGPTNTATGFWKIVWDFTAYGIHTVIVEGEAKHITALDDVTLCNEWAKLKRENNRLLRSKWKICSGWRGFVLRLLE